MKCKQEPCRRCNGTGNVPLSPRVFILWTVINRRHGLTTPELQHQLKAFSIDVTLPFLNNMLRKLESLNHVRREMITAPSGGIMYKWFPQDDDHA